MDIGAPEILGHRRSGELPDFTCVDLVPVKPKASSACRKNDLSTRRYKAQHAVDERDVVPTVPSSIGVDLAIEGKAITAMALLS